LDEGEAIFNGDEIHRNHLLYKVAFRAETFSMNSRATRTRDQILPVLPRDHEDLLATLTDQSLDDAIHARGLFHPA
jgi:hypothetical protein